MNISDIRQDYSKQQLNEKDVSPDPILQFGKWWDDAVKAGISEVNAMTLATSSPDGVPSARIVLLKGYDYEGFVFFTNYESFKGMQLAENPRAALVFFWKELEIQVRITGLVDKTTPAESDAYYAGRPLTSRIGAWASPQSKVIPSRQWLEDNELNYAAKLGADVSRPAEWGGYRVRPVTIEFWQGRESRLHDRIQYSLQNDGGWVIERLAP